ncbi:MAG: hypothetical protein M0017_09935, partial [Desulfobacteraceae bacterium]|nr:hypothetical protein [Desulfobacteraceae bacterium]
MQDIIDQAGRYKSNPINSRTGYVMEADHCVIDNARKALERDSTRAVRESNGNHGDYKVVKDGTVLAGGEVKYHGSPPKTENAMRGYGDRQLVGPSDQIEEIKVVAARKATKGKASQKPARQKVGLEHELVAENATDCISDGKTTSTPRTRKEARRITRKATKGKIGQGDVLPPLGESMKLATRSGAVSGAKLGALVGGVVSGLSNMNAWANDEKSGEDAFVDAATHVTVAAIDGGVKSAAAIGATVLATHAATKVTSTAMKTVLRSSAPAAVVYGAVEVVKDAVDLACGDLASEEFCERATKTTATTGGGWAGAEIALLASTAVAVLA